MRDGMDTGYIKLLSLSPDLSFYTTFTVSFLQKDTLRRPWNAPFSPKTLNFDGHVCLSSSPNKNGTIGPHVHPNSDDAASMRLT
jgi:hypothetical protein